MQKDLHGLGLRNEAVRIIVNKSKFEPAAGLVK